MKLKILGYHYDLEQGGDTDSVGSYGIYLEKKQKIIISGDMCDEAKQSTILHEIIEGLNYHLSLNIPHDKIMCLESGLFQVLRDNGVDLSPLLRYLKR